MSGLAGYGFAVKVHWLLPLRWSTLIGLAKAKRVRAGWLLALVYLLCVLAPTASFALPGEHALAPCLTDENHVPGVPHIRNVSAPRHIDRAGRPHDHSGSHAHTSAIVQDVNSIAADRDHDADRNSHAPDGQCCGLFCLTALPAALVSVAAPSRAMSLCATRVDRPVADNGPDHHYRPPIV